MFGRKNKTEFSISFLKSVKEILNERYQNSDNLLDCQDIQIINIRLESLIERSKYENHT